MYKKLELQDLKALYVPLEKFRLILLSDIQQTEKDLIFRDFEYAGIPGASCEMDNNILKFTVNDVPPLLNRKDHADKEMAEIWQGQLVYAYLKANYRISFAKVFCLIRICINKTTYWDVDNRAVRPIANAIRALRIIRDDKWENMSVCVMGGKAETNKTEVYVFDHNNFEDMLSTCGVKKMW